MEANKIAITDEALRRGAEEGMDGFLKVFIDKYLEVTGGVVNAETMPLLNGYQHSLLGYHFLREEINEGGFVQLIQNGFGPYIFDNPFAKAMRQFVVIDDKEMLKELSHCKEQASSFIADAALAIVVMADPLASDVWIEDAAIASIMIQLQAEDLGLGSCWVQVRERFTATGMPSDEFVHGILDIPLQLQVLSVIAVGHKGMERKPFNEEHLQWEKIHINKFGGK